jgi:hypothetical protein
VTTNGVLIHPRCRKCECTIPRVVAADEICSHCGACDWLERHEAAFELVRHRSDGWYGVQDYQNVHVGDAIEVLIGTVWKLARATLVDTEGFAVVEEAADRDGDQPRRYSHDDEKTKWRWPRDPIKSWVGPFKTEEAARTVLHDWAPGYLVCGVCGWDDWQDKLPAHYLERHGGAADEASVQKSQRPHRRIG